MQRGAVRAGIAAMREPTERMIAAGYMNERILLADRWRDMVDEALASGAARLGLFTFTRT